MKLQKEHVIYVSIIVISILYLVLIEKVQTDQYQFILGGQDLRFSPFDMVLVSVLIVGAALSIISFSAYNRKKDTRLFIIALAFLLFTVKSLMNFVFNFFLGGYQFIGFVSQVLELLIILAFFIVLFKRK